MVTNVSINERESLNSDCQQFHQPISTKQTTPFQLQIIEHKKDHGIQHVC